MREILFGRRAGAVVVASLVAVGGASAANIPVTGYDIQHAARPFGGWSHTYNGTITDTGNGNANGNPFTRADYTGAGSGTLNDGVHGVDHTNTQLFANNAFASPVITLYLGGNFTIDDVTLASFVGGNIIPGCIASLDVTIGGFTETFLPTEPVDNDEFINIIGSSLDGISDNKVILSNFVHDGSSGGVLDELFSISEVVINGQVPAPGALALLGLAGFASRRRRRA